MLAKCARFVRFFSAVALVAVFMIGCDRANDKDSKQDIAQNSQKEVVMQGETLKLVFPQWQGGDIVGFFKDLPASEAAQGYTLGAQILDLLTRDINPALDSNTALVDISSDFTTDSNGARIVQDGIIDKAILQVQNANALKILREKNPAKILTLGGECATSITPFSFLAHRYKQAGEEVALVWIDAHPDLGFAGDEFYKGYHAMAVSALIGDSELQKEFALPAHIKPQNTLLLGLHSNEANHYKSRQKSLGLKSIAAQEFTHNEANALRELTSWLAQINARGVKKVLIHLDLDVLDPRELYVAVGGTGILSIAQIVNGINVISQNAEVVGLTIAEHLPKAQLKLKEMLKKLPLIKE